MKCSHKLSDWHLQRAALGSVQAASESTLPFQKNREESRGAFPEKHILRQRGTIKSGWHWRRIFSFLISEVLRKYQEHLYLHIWSTRDCFLCKKKGARDSCVPSCCSCHSVLSSIAFSNRFQYSALGAFIVTFTILMIRQNFFFLYAWSNTAIF